MTVEPVDDGTGLRVLVARGELDAVVTPALLAQADELVGSASDLVLDLTDVEFLDSGGLRLVDRLHRSARERGAVFGVVAAPGSAPRRLLDLAGMSDLIVHDD